MRRIAVGLGLSVTIAMVQCEGTNTGNPPLASFTASDCRIHQGETPAGTSSAALGSSQDEVPPGTSRQALTSDGGSGDGTLDSNPDDFLWMECIAWSVHDDATLELNFWNTKAGCGVMWVGGSARLEGETLHLEAFQRDCLVAGCGLCIYDLHFEVRDAPRAKDITVTLAYTDGHGTACSDSNYAPRVTLPTSTQRTGTRCNPLVGVGLATPLCIRHAACGDMAQKIGGPACPTCPNGDVCAPITDGQAAQCLKPCTTDADCENPAMGCRNGGCAIVSTWNAR
jgi:hypothetical protein